MNQHDEPLRAADLSTAAEETRRFQVGEVVSRENGHVETVEALVPQSDPAPAPASIARTDASAPTQPTRESRLNSHTPLFSEQDSGELRKRWSEVQGGFVDEPRGAVEQADSLVADVMKRLAEGFAKERSVLEQQWARGKDVTTEDLRVGLQRYRSFFDRLLSA